MPLTIVGLVLGTYEGTPLDWAEYYQRTKAEPSQWTSKEH
jgi:hypothetical protein